MSRPDRLPRWSVHVIKASRRLTLGLKMVWLEDFYLDQGPEGAWVSASNLAQRLGIGTETVEKYRRALSRLGLHESAPRPGGRTMSWFATLPSACVPPPHASVTECITLAGRLDATIDAITGDRPAANTPRTAPQQPVPESGMQPPSDNVGIPDPSPVSQKGTPDSSAARSGHALQSVQSETAPQYTPSIETEVRGRGGALARALHRQPSVSPGKREPEGSFEPDQPEGTPAPIAGLMRKWQERRVT